MKTFKYTTLLISLFLVIVPDLFSQNNPNEENLLSQDPIPLFNGFRLELDLATPFLCLLSKDDVFSMEGSVLLNFKEKFFPAFTIGGADAKNTSSNNYGFQTKGLFYKIGLDYSLTRPNKDAAFRKYAQFGARIGASHFSYDLTNVVIKDDYWQEEEFINRNNIKKTQFWLEGSFGLRVEIAKNVFMGWSTQLKIMLGKEKQGEPSPWYIPGIGIKSVGAWGFNYTIGYNFNL